MKKLITLLLLFATVTSRQGLCDEDQVEVYYAINNHLRITYHQPKVPVQCNLDEVCYYGVLKELVHSRLSEDLLLDEPNLSIRPPQYPIEGLTIQVNTIDDTALEPLSLILTQVENIAKHGFTEDEVLAAKDAVKRIYLQEFSLVMSNDDPHSSAQEEDRATRAMFESLKRVCEPSAQGNLAAYFINAARIVEVGYSCPENEISPNQVQELLCQFETPKKLSEMHEEKNAAIEIAYQIDPVRESMDEEINGSEVPASLDNVNEDSVTDNLGACNEQAQFNTAISGQSKLYLASISGTCQTAYHNLRLTSNDIKDIAYIIKMIGRPTNGFMEKSKKVLKLMKHSDTLNQAGERIEGVHPLRMIGYCFSDPTLKNCMPHIFDSSLTRKKFVDGFSRRMKQEMKRNNVYHLIPDFAKEAHIRNVESLEACVNKCHKSGDYEPFIKLCMNLLILKI